MVKATAAKRGVGSREIEAWLRQRRADSDAGQIRKAASLDVRLHKTRPVNKH